MLAESWDIDSNFTSLQFRLRQGVQFHTGRELTSDDIRFNLTRIQDPKVGAGQFVNQAKWFTTIDTPDKYTVILKADQPRPLIFDFFEYFNIVDQATVQGPNAKTTAVGTGPFKFAEWAQGDHLSFSKNEQYWQSGRPYLDGVHAGIFSDAQAMVVQFESGALDAMKMPPIADFARLTPNAQFQGIVHPNSGSFYLISANVTLPPMDAKLVRQAVNYALNRQRFVDSVLVGLGQAQDLPWLPGAVAYDASKQAVYTYDLDKAKSLLAQANASNLEMDFTFQASAEATALAQILQSDLATLGIKLNVVPVANAVLLDQVGNKKYRGVVFSTAKQRQARCFPRAPR